MTRGSQQPACPRQRIDTTFGAEVLRKQQIDTIRQASLSAG
jgi:hypothetical protein